MTSGVGVPDDWSHHSLVFSAPTNAEQSFRLGYEPRYYQQRFRRIPIPQKLAGNDSIGSPNADLRFPIRRPFVEANEGLWGQSLSATGGNWASSGPGVYPAKFGFYDTTTINCGNASTPDFVAYGLQSGTVSSQTGTFTGNPTNGQTVTLGGSLVLTASASTPATGTVTIATEPNYQDTVTVGSTTYIWQSSAATAATGSVVLATEPGYQDTVTIGGTTYIWQSSASTNATGTVGITTEPLPGDKVQAGSTVYIWQTSTTTAATGTVNITSEPAYQDTVTVGSTTYIWQAAATTTATGSMAFASVPNAGDEITVGATTYIFETSCTGVNNCIVIGHNPPTNAASLASAIGGTCGGNACSANASVTASSTGANTNLTAKTAGTAGNFMLTLPVNSAGNSVTGGNNAVNSCAGVNNCVVLNTNTGTDVTNLKNAIGGSCGGNACSANSSVTATSAGNTVSLTAVTTGAAGDFTLSLPVNGGGNSVSGGNNGGNGCTGVNDCVVLNSQVNTDATNLASAIAGTCGGNACSANSSVTASTSGSTVTLTAKTTGPSGDFTLSLPVNGAGNSVAGGNNGTNSCASVNDCVVLSTNTNTDATNLANAIAGTCGGNACSANASVTAATSAHTVNLTAKTAGSASDFTLTLPVNSAANTVSGGNNGTNSCAGVNDCVVLSTNTGTDATNLKNAVGGTCGGNACSANSSVTATSNSNTVTLTAVTPGSSGDFTLSLPVNGGSNTVSGGNNGTDGANTGTNFQTGVSTSGDAANLATAIARNGPAVGVTATWSSGQVTVTSTVGGSIALAETLTNFSWASGTIAGTLTGGSSSQATIVAYDNLYSSCSGTAPSVYWSYNTSTSTATNAQVMTSPVLSVDGTQIAFVETSGTTAYLVVLRWKAGQGTSASAPVTPTTQATTGASYVTCKAGTGSCQLTLSLGHNDTSSSPFVDYKNDILYVGDSNGTLHQVTGIFNGTPALDSTNAGWPVNVDGGAGLTSPVYDSGSSLVFVGDTKGKLSSVTTGASPTTKNSGQIEFRTGGVGDSPIVDSTTGSVYVFVACDATCSASSNNAVFKFGTSIANGSTGTKQILATTGTTITSQKLYLGSFDNTYYAGSGNTGNLYACGYSTGLDPVLYEIPMSSTWGSATVSSTSLTGGPGSCSPLTENLSGVANTDWLFLSVTANGNLTGCAGDCIYSFNVYTGTPAYSAGRHATAGASGIIIDNSASATGASQIYYATQGVATTTAGYSCPSPSGGAGAATAGGCAVQASQASLQ